jgi:hypothetical protein
MDLKRDHIRFGTCLFLVGKRHFLPRTKYHQTPQGVFGWVWPFGPPPTTPSRKPWVAWCWRSALALEVHLLDQKVPSSRTANNMASCWAAAHVGLDIKCLTTTRQSNGAAQRLDHHEQTVTMPADRRSTVDLIDQQRNQQEETLRCLATPLTCGDSVCRLPKMGASRIR